jgi:hypothetical protein
MHTYAPPVSGASVSVSKTTVSADSVIVNDAPPPPPYNVLGYATDGLGAPVFGAAVTVTDVNTGAVWTTVTDDVYGYYMVDLNTQPTLWVAGDTIHVDVVKGFLSGSNEGIAMSPGNEAFLWLDVSLTGAPPPVTYTVTLMVTDTFGQTASTSMDVTI